MKSFSVSIGILGLIGVLIFQTALAATTATVTATVTVQSISLTITDGTVAYGTLGNNSSADTNPADTQDAVNNGNIIENFNIQGSNSANWTLGAVAASDVYVHKFCTSSCGTPPTNYTALTTSDQTLATGVAASASQSFDLYITTPNPSTVFTQQSVNVTVTAVSP